MRMDHYMKTGNDNIELAHILYSLLGIGIGSCILFSMLGVSLRMD